MREQIWNYVIGDIHGCFDELLLLEEKIKIYSLKNNVKSFIISVGDLIDRGPKSKEVVEHFRHGFANKTHTAIMGNHEICMLEALEAFAPENFRQEGFIYPEWFQKYKLKFEYEKGHSKYLLWVDCQITNKNNWIDQGGDNSLKSFGCDPNNVKTWFIKPDILSFLINLPFYWENKYFIITHAIALPEDLKTVQSVIPVQKKGISKKLKGMGTGELRKLIASLIWNRIDPSLRPHENKSHISGHTPMKKVKRNKKFGAIQIDTGCVFGGRLTALCLETNKLIFVKAKKKYHD